MLSQKYCLNNSDTVSRCLKNIEMTIAASQDSDQHGQASSLMRVFSNHMKKAKVLTVQLPRLIRVLTVGKVNCYDFVMQ